MTTEPLLPGEFTALGGLSCRTADPIWTLQRFHNSPSRITVIVDRLRRPYVDSRDIRRFNYLQLEQPGRSQDIRTIPRRPSTLSSSLRDLIIAYLVYQAEQHTGANVARLCWSIAWFEEWVHDRELARAGDVKPANLPQLIAGFAAHSRATRRLGCQGIRRFFRWAYERRLPGFGKRAWYNVRDERFYSVKGGTIAKTGHPTKGALSILEQRMIRQALHAPSANTELEDLLLVWFFFELGRRALIASRVLVAHLRRSPLGDQYFIALPRMKRGKPTHATIEREISVELGRLLEQFAQSHGNRWLFPSLRRSDGRYTVSELVAAAMKRFVRANTITTLRTPQQRTRWGFREAPLRLTTYRFRYTLATNLAIRGASPEQIAAILDDDTLETALIYANHSSSMVDLLEATLDRYPLWRRTILKDFQGKLLPEEADGEGTLIVAGALHLSGFEQLRRRRLVIGRCGNPDPCNLHPPISCYRCSFFGATKDPQPHLAQFEQLKKSVKTGVGTRSDRMTEVLLPDLLAIRDLLDELGGRSAVSKISESIMQESM